MADPQALIYGVQSTQKVFRKSEFFVLMNSVQNLPAPFSGKCSDFPSDLSLPISRYSGIVMMLPHPFQAKVLEEQAWKIHFANLGKGSACTAQKTGSWC